MAPGLIAASEREQVIQNAARARQLQSVHDLAVCFGEDPTSMSPSSEVGLEIGGVLGVSEVTVWGWLTKHQQLTTWLPGVWALCESGRLDLWKAQVFLDAADTLADDDEIALFSADVDAYFAKYDDPTTAVVRLTRAKLQRAAQYRAMKRRRKDKEVTYAEAFTKRRAWFRPDEHGMGSLGVRTAVHDLIAADYRLTLISKKRLESDDQNRTLDQMRADTMVDLLMGRLEVTALNSDLEDDETADGEDPAKTFGFSEVGAFARPVINVTVPISTLMGLDDAPGLLSGDITIPADLARAIALGPDSTWYRLLTDAGGRFVELSTTSYAPTAAIWRTDVARDRTCVWPGCCRPSVVCDIDHRVPFPHGETSTCNTWPLCRRHHLAKHAAGYTVVIEDDGSYLFTTRNGTELRTRAS
ncbi:MAG TPA: HNH endonuclease signature motif containing protein [Nocardioidaceae bacterium]|nr:HNH endonuclease signature motif containing protein [Nocardioidaceae bacterium]